MTTPDGLTAERDFAIEQVMDRYHHVGPNHVPEDDPIGECGECADIVGMFLVVEKCAVARHVRETGCDGLREALARHRLMLPPHPHGFYIHSALCSCDTWQWDGPGPDLSLVAEQVWAVWGDHLRAALAPTVAASEACRPAALPHHWPASRERQDEAGNVTTETYCWRCGIALATPATEAERRGGEE